METSTYLDSRDQRRTYVYSIEHNGLISSYSLSCQPGTVNFIVVIDLDLPTRSWICLQHTYVDGSATALPGEPGFNVPLGQCSARRVVAQSGKGRGGTTGDLREYVWKGRTARAMTAYLDEGHLPMGTKRK